MKVILYLSSKKREQEFHQALVSGIRMHGDECEYIAKQDFGIEGLPPDTDVVVMVGVKSWRVYRECQARGVKVLLIDKGYFRNREYYRFSLGGYQPPYLWRMNKPQSRMLQLGVRLRPRNTEGKTIIYAGSSHKYCNFHGIEDVNEYARKVCAELVEHAAGKYQVIYRPKPSWWAKGEETAKRTAPDYEHLPPNTKFSGPDELLSQLLPDCHCLVTHGSTAALDALAAGVPVHLLSQEGVSPAWGLCETNIANISNPYWPSDGDRTLVFSNLAWCQFNVTEMRNGTAWANLKPWSEL